MMDEHVSGVNANAVSRFGRYYVRRRGRNSNESMGNQIEINKQNRIRGHPSQKDHNTTSVQYINNNTLIDVPIQVQPIQNGNAYVVSIQPDVRNHSDGMIEVPVQVQTAASSSSRPTKRPRKSRSRRVNFESIIVPTPPRKLSPRERNAIRQRRFRARMTPEQRLVSQARQNIRRRNARLRQTPEQRAAAQALDTARRRLARQRKRAQQLDKEDRGHQEQLNRELFYIPAIEEIIPIEDFAL